MAPWLKDELADDVLWRRVRDGETEAFGTLFERHERAIYNYCFRQTANWTTAEDLTSIVFFEAWRRRRKELDANKVLAWLYGITTNVIRNHRRSERRYRAALGRLHLPEAISEATDDDVLGRIDDESRMAEILVIAANLPIRQRDVLMLCDWEGLNYEDASFALRLPVGTVKSNLSRARKRIRELVSADGHIQDENMVLETECERNG